MKRHVLPLFVVSVLVSAAPPAAAQRIAVMPPATPPPRVAPAASEREPTSRTERNSLPLLFTGVGLALVGLGGLGGGYAANVVGRQDCDAAALATTGRLELPAGAAAYGIAYSRCTNQSGAVLGGTGAMIAGGTFVVVGTVFAVAGAWKVTVPIAPRSAFVPKVDVGTSSLGLRWTF